MRKRLAELTAAQPPRPVPRCATGRVEPRIALGQVLLKLTCPGVPDLYQGDELETLSLVDPDNRRPVDWQLRTSALADNRDPKLRLTRKTLELRDRRAAAFAGSYEPVDLGPNVCAYVRGGSVLVVVPVRNVPLPPAPSGWTDVLGSDLGVGLYER